MGKFKKLMEVSSNIGGYSDADEGEPDTGFIRGDKERVLGGLAGKPEPWFEKGGYTQVDFPVADRAYEKGDKKTQMVYVVKKIKNVGDKYQGFQDAVGSWDKYGDEDYSTDFDYKDLLDL